MMNFSWDATSSTRDRQNGLACPGINPEQVGRLDLPRVRNLPVDYRRPYRLGAGPLRSRNTVANASAIVSGSIRQTTPHIASG